MKILVVHLLALFIISSANNIVSMNDGKIFFRINKELKIWRCTSCNSFTAENCNQSCNFESCEIQQILPLSEEKKREINQAFITAENLKIPVYVIYDHDNKSYKAKIQLYKGLWTKYTVVVKPNVKKH